MQKDLLEKFLACFSASIGMLVALGAALIPGVALAGSGQRVPYGAGLPRAGSAALLPVIATSLFRKAIKTQRRAAAAAG
ncbi:MAG: hypothetical protein KGN77_06550 [Xanthomonadaceae bacterium]|nr:hypothetical protein [Xanthomonadaceae bacterium]MDE1963302.1 hypothetical protein [Xanthomonadaceae bacterium]